MPRNTSSGVYTAPTNSWNPATAGTTISPTDWAATLADLSTALGHATASTRALYPTLGQVQDAAFLAAATGGTATAITLTLTPAVPAYANYATYRIKVTTSCGVNPTLNVNGLGARKIYIMTAGGLAQASTGDLVAGDIETVIYDSSLDSGTGGFVVASPGPIGWRSLETRTVSAVAQSDFTLPAAYRMFRLTFLNIVADTNGRALALRFSTDGGSSFIAGTSYVFGGVSTSSAAFTATGQGATGAGCVNIAGPLAASGAPSWSGSSLIAPGTASFSAIVNNKSFGNDGTNWIDVSGGGSCAAGAVTNALRVYSTTNVSAGTAGGSFSGTLILEGLR